MIFKQSKQEKYKKIYNSKLINNHLLVFCRGVGRILEKIRTTI